MNAATPGPAFREVISSEEELEAILGRPSPRVIAKVTDTIDALSRDFIARSPFRAGRLLGRRRELRRVP